MILLLDLKCFQGAFNRGFQLLGFAMSHPSSPPDNLPHTPTRNITKRKKIKGRRTFAQALLVLIAVTILGFPFLSVYAATQLPISADGKIGSDSANATADAGPKGKLTLQTLPIYDLDGPVGKAVTRYLTTKTTRLREGEDAIAALGALSKELGLNDVAAALPMMIRSPMAEVITQLEVDSFLDAAGASPAALEKNPAVWNDLAAGMALIGPSEGIMDSGSDITMAALTLWNRLSDHPDNSIACTASINGLFFTESDQLPSTLDAVKSKCGADNPLPNYVDVLIRTYRINEETPVEYIAESVEPWRKLATDYPESPEVLVGFSTVLSLAAERESGFLARDYAEEAAKYAQAANTIVKTWQGTLALARAQALLVDPAAARQTVADWEPETATETYALATFLTRVGNAKDAASLLEVLPTKPHLLGLDSASGCAYLPFYHSQITLPGAPVLENGEFRRPGQHRSGGCGDAFVTHAAFIPSYNYRSELLEFPDPRVNYPLPEIQLAKIFLMDPNDARIAEAIYSEEPEMGKLHFRQAFDLAIETGNTAFAKSLPSSKALEISEFDRLYMQAIAAWSIDSDAKIAMQFFEDIRSKVESDAGFSSDFLPQPRKEADVAIAEAMAAGAIIARRSGDDALAEQWRSVAEPYIARLKNPRFGQRSDPSYPDGEQIVNVWNTEEAMAAAAAGDSGKAYEKLKENETQDPAAGKLDPQAAANANNLALVAIKDPTRTEEAIANAEAALASDPTNPVFLDTYAWVVTQASPTNALAALQAYDDALKADPTNFDAWNNAAVLTAQSGDRTRAIEMLRRAVGVNPDYPLGWANLATLLTEQGGIWNTIKAQGAWAKAVSLDGNFRGATAELTFDSNIYGEVLDLSKPVSADWQFAKHTRLVKSQAPWGAIVVGILGLLAAFGRNHISTGWIAKLLAWLGLSRTSTWFRSPSSDKSDQTAGNRILGRRGLSTSLWIAVLVSTILLTRYSGGGGPDGVSSALLMTVGMALVVATPVAARTAFSPVSAEDKHNTWWPVIIVGSVTALLGSLLVPAPLLKKDTSGVRHLRIIGLVALAILTLAALVLSLVTNVPLTRATALAGIVTLGTLLIAVKPLDGAYINSKLLLTASATLVAILGVVFERGIF